MARAKVPLGRSIISESPEGLLITIPAKKNWGLIFFLGVWLIGWTFGEAAAVHELLRVHRSHAAHMSANAQLVINFFMLVWLTGWTVGGGVAALLWLWNFVGVELILLGPSTLTTKRAIAGIGPRKEYELQNATDLRVSASPFNFNQRMSPFQMMSNGTIAFYYGAKTFRCGLGLDEAEAQQIIERLKSRHTF